MDRFHHFLPNNNTIFWGTPHAVSLFDVKFFVKFVEVGHDNIGTPFSWGMNIHAMEPHGVEFQVMATGFTWDTQNRESDTAACREVWQHAKRMLADSSLDMVLLDELTYMVAYDYLPLEDVIQALNERPHQQTVIITGRGCHRDILELADTVSD